MIEEQSQISWYSYNTIGTVKRLDINVESQSTPEHRSVLAAYREAMNSTNVFYKIICFYRVVEGVRKLRNEKRHEVLLEGGTPHEPDERIPATAGALPDDLQGNASIMPYLGWRFNRVIDHNRDDLRNAAAHLDPTDEHLSVDRYDDVERFERLLPIIKYIAREMLRNQLPVVFRMTEGSQST